jgi:hypothetical protein
MAGLAVTIEVAALIHQFLTPANVDFGWSFRGFVIGPVLTFVGIGTAICLRDTRNPIGWLLLTDGFLFAVSGGLSEYGIRGLIVDPGSLPGALVAAWIIQWLWTVMFGMVQFVFLLFPDGRLTPRRRVFATVGTVVIAAAGVVEAFYPRSLDSFATSPKFQNPYPWHWLTAGDGALEGILLMLWSALLVGTATAVLVRFRGASGVERLQLKWFAVGAIFTALAFFSIPLLSNAANGLQEGLTVIGISLLPLTIGIAILRYRLYEIDVIINRTLVYGSLTAILAGAYLAIVFIFQALLTPLTSQSDIAIAASTLAVAALFRPLRSRVQRFIDKRFYRRRFDAQRTLEGFSATVRDEVDLSALSDRLTEVVSETMQPTHISLWLRAPGVSP